MIKQGPFTSIIAITLMIITYLLFGYHLTNLLSKKESKHSEIPTVLLAQQAPLPGFLVEDREVLNSQPLNECRASDDHEPWL